MNIDSNRQEALLKEYELCFNGVQHHNTRVWASGSIFITASFTASGWLINQAISKDFDTWIAFFVVILLFLFTSCYTRIIKHWTLLDRIEFYRAEEIEKELSLWRVRYRNYVSEDTSKTPEEGAKDQVNAMKETVARRMKTCPEKLPNLTATNRYFHLILWIPPFATLFFLAIHLFLQSFDI